MKALHDEDVEFRETQARISKGDWFAAWLIAYKGTLLEGLEVWLVVVAFSLHSRAWLSNGLAALIALLAVFLAGPRRSARRFAACRRTRSNSSSAR